MVKKNALLFGVLVASSSCFGMQKPPKKNNQNFFSAATMQLLKFFFNPNKPKQLPAPTPIHKEFVCKEIIKTNDPKFNTKTKTDEEIEREIQKEMEAAWIQATAKYKKK